MPKKKSKKSSALSKILFSVYILVLIIVFWWLFGDSIVIETKHNDKSSQNSTGFVNITGTLKISPNYIKDWYENSLLENTDSMYIQMYSITYRRMQDILKLAAQRGTEIKLMLENKQYKSSEEHFYKLKKELSHKNIQIKSDTGLNTNYMHSKFFVFDEKFIIQTANLGYSSFFKNREFFFQSRNEEVLKSLENIFKKDRKGEKLQKADIHPNLLVCNINCRDKLEKLLNNAEKSIYIQTQNLSDSGIIDILKEKEEKLKEKIMLAELDYNQQVDNDFEEKTVRIYDKNYLHGKSILIDGKILILGSINLTENSLDNNREVSIVILNKEIIRKYMNNFEKDRGKAE